MTERHALIIDDNVKNAKILGMLLKGQNVASTPVNKPQTLNSIIPTLPEIDVVFLDLEMPMMNGFQVMDILRAASHFDGVPIIAYSVHIDQMGSVNKYGFDGFLGKPVDSDEFPQVLGKILNGDPVWIRPS